MTPSEIKAQIQAFTDALQMLTHHASLCIEAHSLSMDLEASIRRRIVALEADLVAKRKSKSDG